MIWSLEIKGSELFCHEPLTGDILRSPSDMNGEFGMEQQFKAVFCQVIPAFLETFLDLCLDLWIKIDQIKAFISWII